LFDKLSIQAEMLRVGEYKSAAEPYTRSEMSPAFKEEMDALLDDNYQRTLKMVSEARGLSLDAVKQVIDTALLTGNAAKEAGLIDGCIYEGDLNTLAKGDRADVEIEVTKNYGRPKLDTDFSGLNGFVKMMNLLAGVEPAGRASKSAKIAIVYATGMIMPGPSVTDLMGGQVLGSTTMIKAIRQARDDETVKAIVLRIDSPGGSALASDLIWHELETVTKPVVVSMGDTAASGGYYIAMGADRIFAEPGTLTGSIGVVGGKFALEKFLQKFGVTTSVLQRGKNGGIISVMTPFTDSERTAFQQMLNDTYKQFTEKAATGRKMEYAALEALARGRVYTGTQALAVGLVDQLGTVEDAVAFAKQAADLTATDRVERLRLPKPSSPLEQFFGPIDSEARLRAAITNAVRDTVPTAASELLEGLNLSTLLASEPVLTVLPYQLRIR
jgi:protease-4